VQGELPANGTARYVLRAFAGQLLDVTLTAPMGASLSVTAEDGRVLTPPPGGSPAGGYMGYRGYLPKTGDTILEVAAGSQPAWYGMHVSIPRRISFARCATSKTVSGHVDPHQSLEYILRARAGQLMEIEVTPANSVQLIIFGVDGTVLRSGMGEGSSFRGEVPISQDYIVAVRAGDQGVSFSMNVIIPQRIRFAQGASSASLQGRLRSHQTQYYVLRGSKNQTLRVEVTPEGVAQLIIYGADGTVLRSGMGEGSSFSGKLPSTQDYVLAVRAGPDPAVYTLEVTIR